MSIDKEAEDAFQHWYQTEGIRTPAPTGEHWHEAYQRMAFMGAVSYLDTKALFLEYDVTELEKEVDELEAKVKAISKLVKVLIRQNRK